MPSGKSLLPNDEVMQMAREKRRQYELEHLMSKDGPDVIEYPNGRRYLKTKKGMVRLREKDR